MTPLKGADGQVYAIAQGNLVVGGFGAEGFSDIFGDVFGDIFGGGRRSRTRAYRGADLGYALTLDLEQAAFGDEVTIRAPVMAECGECGGSGAEKDSGPTTCETCGGSGQHPPAGSGRPRSGAHGAFPGPGEPESGLGVKILDCPAVEHPGPILRDSVVTVSHRNSPPVCL